MTRRQCMYLSRLDQYVNRRLYSRPGLYLRPIAFIRGNTVCDVISPYIYICDARVCYYSYTCVCLSLAAFHPTVQTWM